MNIGLYQSAASLSALERWQESVTQNIASSNVAGYRKQTVNFSTRSAGEVQGDPRGRVGRDAGNAMLFPKANSAINFINGETLPTHRDLDVAIQGEGFFEVLRPDGSHAFLRGGQFHLRADRTLVTSDGNEVVADGGGTINLLPTGGAVVINRDGTIFQGDVPLGKLSVQKFPDNAQLVPVSGGMFLAPPGVLPESVENPDLMQGYVEGSNVMPLREMVDMVLISRAYEANQKMISTLDQQMEKTLDALG